LTTLEQHTQKGIALWKLFMKALPALINLTHLYFRPHSVHFPNAANDALRQCTFQLKSLAWRCSNMNDFFPEFLVTQRSLLHLDLGARRMNKFPKLAQDACPSLKSVACVLSAFPCVATGSKIVGFRMTDVNRQWLAGSPPLQLDLASIGQIKYMSVHIYAPIPNSPFSNIVLLEIRNWIMKVHYNTNYFLCYLLGCLHKVDNHLSTIDYPEPRRSLRAAYSGSVQYKRSPGHYAQ
jgi:hypothetical protein